MLQPQGFSQHAIVTSLGTMAYYTAENAPWRLPDERPVERPTLVFLHGFGGGSSAYEWSKVYPAFAFDYRILAPDLLGWGRSEHLTRDYQIEDYLVTLREFLEQTCPEPVTVIASSLTAGLVIQLAIAHPHLFKSLILSAPAGLSDFGKNYKDGFFAKLVSVPVLDRLLYSTAIATNSGIRGFLSNRQFVHSNRISQEMVDAYLASAQLPNAEYTALSFVRGDLCFDLAEFVPLLTTPTAIIWGKQAQLTEYTIGKKLARLNPQAIRFLEILDDVGLTPQLELPAVMIGVIQQFLKGL
jgi:pimeloyl-ACP methyl ester carboxylesterase